MHHAYKPATALDMCHSPVCCDVSTFLLPPQSASKKTYDEIAAEVGLTNAYVAQVRHFLTRSVRCPRLRGL